MWKEVIGFLKDPELVAHFQELFGVEIYYKDSSSELSDIDESEELTHSEEDSVSEYETQNLNGYLVSTERRNTEEGSSNESENSQKCIVPFTIKSKFWYCLFLFATELGDEIFYSAFIPFWFWNIDGTVGRKIVLVWATIMTIGQALKDIICWPRPECPPVVRLQQKWSQEYGMPSTHAMVGVSIPFSIIIFTKDRYVYPFPLGNAIAILWCILVCMSRIYLGMHTLLDVIVGFVLAMLFMIPLVPFVNIMDVYIVTHFQALSVLVAISILIIVYFPCGEKWTPTRGDTTMVVSVTAGVYVGAWLNYKMGVIIPSEILPPYKITWPSCSMLACLILRTTLGFFGVIMTKVICKPLIIYMMHAILRINPQETTNESNDLLHNRNTILIDLVYKYVTCFMIGVNTVYISPIIFSMIGIERPTFYTEL